MNRQNYEPGDITYRYQNIEIISTNKLLNIHLDKFGLQLEYLYGLSSQKTCVAIQYPIDKLKRGSLAIIKLDVIEAILLEALKHGLVKKTLDKKWNVQQFQFYLGDLGSAFEKAN